MIKRIITLYKIGRTLALSDALEVIYKFHQPPIVIKFIFKILSISILRSGFPLYFDNELQSVEISGPLTGMTATIFLGILIVFVFFFKIFDLILYNLDLFLVKLLLCCL